MSMAYNGISIQWRGVAAGWPGAIATGGVESVYINQLAWLISAQSQAYVIAAGCQENIHVSANENIIHGIIQSSVTISNDWLCENAMQMPFRGLT